MRLKQLRGDIPQKEFAAKIGQDVSMLSRFENYKCLPAPETMNKITQLLNCDVEDIYDKKEIAFKHKKKEKKCYKLTARLPEDLKADLTIALLHSEYKSVQDWVTDCAKKFIQGEKI